VEGVLPNIISLPSGATRAALAAGHLVDSLNGFECE
jgi:hypothetical protein